MEQLRENDPLTALLVGEYEGDRLLVHEVFKRLEWRLFEARDRSHAMRWLERKLIHVVIAKTDLPHWNWRRVLSDLRKLTKPPQLVVTSRTADESLWAEVLNIGGYDVMALPFEPFEVERVIASAHRHFLLPQPRAAANIA